MKNSQKTKITTKMKVSFNRMELLAKSTPSEKSACNILTSMGIKYVKQYPIFTGRKAYYADIYIPSLKLILEIDGGYHFTKDQKRNDNNRSANIRRLGYHIYRLSNRDARSVNKVMQKLLLLRRRNNLMV